MLNVTFEKLYAKQIEKETEGSPSCFADSHVHIY